MTKDPRTQRELKRTWLREFPWIGVIGSIVMFLSWILQSQFASNAAAERMRLDRSQLSIDLQQMRMESWQAIYMQEKAKAEPNKSILLASAYKTLQSQLNLAAWASARIREKESDAGSDISQKNAVQAALAKMYRDQDLAALEDDLRKSANVLNQLNVIENFNSKFEERMTDVRRQEQWFTLLFSGLYVLGTFMLGVQFLLKFRAERTQSKK